MKRKTISTTPILSEEIHLENVVGVTVQSNASMARSSSGKKTSGSDLTLLKVVLSGVLGYPAGYVIVLLDGGEQLYIIKKDRKTVTCLAWAADGSHLVSGESSHKPAVCNNNFLDVACCKGSLVS